MINLHFRDLSYFTKNAFGTNTEAASTEAVRQVRRRLPKETPSRPRKVMQGTEMEMSTLQPRGGPQTGSQMCANESRSSASYSKGTCRAEGTY